MLFPEAERDESPANMSQSTSVDEILNGRSFMQILKRRGPRTDSCGAQTLTQPSGEYYPATNTLRERERDRERESALYDSGCFARTCQCRVLVKVSFFLPKLNF